MINSLIHSNIVCPDWDKNYPRISYGKGVYLYDEGGKQYLDAAGGSAAVSNIGYGITEIADIMRDQASKVSVLPAHCMSSPVIENYLKALVNFAPAGFSRAWTVTSGTEAVENAVKLSLQHHQLKGEKQKHKVIGRWGSYHGNSIFMLDIGGMKLRRNSYMKWLHNFPHIPPAYSYRMGDHLTEEEYTEECARALEQAILEEGPENVAAFVVEPVVAAALGAVPPPRGYFKIVREICTKYNVHFIVDEVLTGFGRTGKNFGIENWDVVPDIIATGKGISGGYVPLSAIIARDEIMEVFEKTKTPFLGGHTFACYPLGAAVGTFVLEYIKSNKLVENAREMGELFLKKLDGLRKYDIIGDVRGVGLMAGIEIVSDKVTRLPFPKELNLSKRIGEKSIQKGVILYPGKGSYDGESGDHIMITPPLIIDASQIDRIVNVLDECLAEVTVELKQTYR